MGSPVFGTPSQPDAAGLGYGLNPAPPLFEVGANGAAAAPDTQEQLLGVAPNLGIGGGGVFTQTQDLDARA